MSPKVLIVRTSALGDVVHCLPVLTALRRHLPEARIAWVVEEAMAPVLDGHPDLDERLPVRLRTWRHRLTAATTRRELGTFAGRLREFRAEVALDLMGNFKAALIARLSGAPRRVGLARSFRREPASALWINEPATPRGPHAVDRALSVLEAAFGLPSEPADFGAEKLFPGQTATAPRDSVLLHPGAGWHNKVYPAAWWGEVARRLEASAGLPTRVAIAPGEEELADAVVEASDGAARPVAAGDLTTLAGLLRSARLVLGGDTGPVHLAHALGTPVLSVHGPTDPRRHGPHGAPERALAEPLPCSYCYKRLDGIKACLLSLSPRRVAERALAVVETAEGQRS